MNLQKHVVSVLLLLLVLSSCNTMEATPPAATVTAEPAAELPDATDDPVTPSPVPVATAADDSIHAFFPSHATKLENVSHTINGVTVQIDSAYVDESRVAIQYTISGLDWPDGSFLDNTQMVQMSIPAISPLQAGGFNGAGGGNVSEVKQGVITGSSDQLLLDGALDAEKHSSVTVEVDIPVEGPTKIGTFHLRFTAPVANGIKIENIAQTVVANNVSMTLESLILNPSYAQALICFQMPSPLDWGLTASRITIAEHEYPFTSGGLVSGRSEADSTVTSPGRCNEVGFDIAHEFATPTSVTLTVPKLMASVSEVITEETVNKANERLVAQGIVFDYESIDHGGNIVILARPDGMSDEQIYPLIRDALAEQHEGPWVFTVPIP